MKRLTTYKENDKIYFGIYLFSFDNLSADICMCNDCGVSNQVEGVPCAKMRAL